MGCGSAYRLAKVCASASLPLMTRPMFHHLNRSQRLADLLLTLFFAAIAFAVISHV